ncbi:MAG: IS66 family insertion sequence element accessory protein TnpB [Pseudomonadota bacterium]|nr:IS66 family insertion sequence element accessory protein TnpB [Pseudomonadota bacterium]
MSPVSAEFTETESYWAAHLERQERSGLSVREYCGREGFSQGSFYNWRKRLASSPEPASPALPPSAFVELTHLFAPPRVETPRWEMELALPGGAVVRLARGFDSDGLRRALELLAPC